MITTCQISNRQFTVSEHEIALREKFGFKDVLPQFHPDYRFREVGAFWPHWNLHKRKSDKSGKDIISVFRPDCPYPIWHRDEWIEFAKPPFQDFDFSKLFFEQAWQLFQKCPLPHNFQSHNQNCEYTDDWYYSKNCYLCHSGQGNEDCRYCYGCDHIKDLFYSVFAFDSELCIDLINCTGCYESIHLLNCKQVHNSAFLYDCRGCKNCLFCHNLRNKEYCFGNQQLTKEKFEKVKKEWDFSSLKNYERAKKTFKKMMKEAAWHRALQIDKSENCTGNYIRNSKDLENCFLLSFHENCANVSFCGPNAKTILDSLGTVGAELAFYCSLPVFSYEAKFCFSVSHSRFVEYSAYLQNCEHCFGCCGLMNEKYCIFNKQYSKEEYFVLKEKIIEHMKKTDEWGKFFPGHFAPNPYDESYSGYHFPLSENEKQKNNFRTAPLIEKISVKTAEITEIPDNSSLINPSQKEWLTQQVFWDKAYKRPFQIQMQDIEMSQKLHAPLAYCSYINRIQDNFKYMPIHKSMREAKCAISGKPIKTNISEEFDGRILSEEEYLKIVK